MPLGKQRFGPRKWSQSAPATPVSSRRPNKRKQWADNDMVEGIKAVKNGMSLKQAAEMYGIPSSTSTMSSPTSGQDLPTTTASKGNSLSKYFTLSSRTPPTHPKTSPWARLLTSAKALAQVEEKERKKKETLEKKQHKKAERIEKSDRGKLNTNEKLRSDKKELRQRQRKKGR